MKYNLLKSNIEIISNLKSTFYNDPDLIAHEEFGGSHSTDSITCQYQSMDADQTTFSCCQSQY